LFPDAKEILRNPALKAEWESVTGKKLPKNEKRLSRGVAKST
jgi:hypothetical protein